MPKVRKSNRIKSKQTSVNKESTDLKTPFPGKPNIISKEKVEANSEPEICFACKQKHPPIRRYNVVECACITAEDCVRLAFYDISYTCAVCCLKGSPWIVENHRLPGIYSAGIECVQERKAEELEIKETVKQKGVRRQWKQKSGKRKRDGEYYCRRQY